MSKEEYISNIIGEGSFFEGKLKLRGSLRIDGKFEGEQLKVDHLIIGKTGRIKTNILSHNVVIEGIIIGNITASTRVLLLPTARILGDIKTPELIIQNGVILEGKVTISTKLEEPAQDIIFKLYNNS